jgi:hypothetical protein
MASYGLIAEPIFTAGKHPEHLKYQDKVDGNVRCRDVMRWCAVKVVPFLPAIANFEGTKVEDGLTIRHSFVQHYSRMSYQLSHKFLVKAWVFICDDANPPDCRDGTGTFTVVGKLLNIVVNVSV